MAYGVRTRLFLLLLMRASYLVLISASQQAARLRVDVFGGGFTGLAAAYYALQDTRVAEVRVVDTKRSVSAVGGASVASAGLLHSYSPRGKKIWMGDEGYALTMALVLQAEAVSGKVIVQPGVSILRQSSGSQDGTAAAVEEIRGGCVLDPLSYLEGLWTLLCHTAMNTDTTLTWVVADARKEMEAVRSSPSLSESDGYRVVRICALGAAAVDERVWPDAPVLSKLGLERGRNIVLDNSSSGDGEGVLRYARIQGEYVVPNFGGGRIILGATHERQWDTIGDTTSPAAEPELQMLVGKIAAKGLYGHGDGAEVDLSAQNIQVTDGVRVQAKNTHLGRLPLVSRHPFDQDTWLVTGFGSRGLIHHALVSRAVVQAAIERDVGLVPSAIYFPPSSGEQ